MRAKLLTFVTLCVALLVTPAEESDALTFECYNQGACLEIAGCDGDWFWGYCSIQCWVQSDDCPVPGTCWEAAGAANCRFPS